MQKKIESIPASVMKALTAWEWPGNVRELENFVERAVILSRGRSLTAPLAELHKVTTDEPKGAANNTATNHEDIARIVKETITALHGNSSAAGDRAQKQRDQIVRALTEAKGRVGGVNGAAVRLRTNRTTLLARMKKLGIDPRDFS
jgi:transcriptional regulator with GAF, ATPase, and Fis domain